MNNILIIFSIYHEIPSHQIYLPHSLSLPLYPTPTPRWRLKMDYAHHLHLSPPLSLHPPLLSPLPIGSTKGWLIRIICPSLHSLSFPTPPFYTHPYP